jgi:activator of HSP90 ATPase
MSSGKNKEGVDVAGSIRVPECAYDTEEDEYVVSEIPSWVVSHLSLTGREV